MCLLHKCFINHIVARMFENVNHKIERVFEKALNIIGSKFTDLIHEGKLSKNDVSDMGDILLGKAPGRESDDQIIVYSVGGMPVEDVAWGSILYRRALEQGIGVKLHLWDAPTLA